MGLLTEVVAAGRHLERALESPRRSPRFPQETMLADRRAAIEGFGLPLDDGARARGRGRAPPTLRGRRGAAPRASPAARAAAARAPGV